MTMDMMQGWIGYNLMTKWIRNTHIYNAKQIVEQIRAIQDLGDEFRGWAHLEHHAEINEAEQATIDYLNQKKVEA